MNEESNNPEEVEVDEEADFAESLPPPPITYDHSPLPWSVLPNHYGLYDAGNRELGTILGFGITNQEDEANRRLLIRAVNSHAALVNLLEETSRELSSISDAESQYKLLNRIEAALALAKESQ